MSRPTIEVNESENTRTLLIPEGFDFARLPDRGGDLIRNFLMGHPLQPYTGVGESYPHSPYRERIALGEPGLTLKPAQREAISAFEGAVARGDKSFLFVAPTGLGKTEVLKAVIRNRLQSAPPGRKLHIVAVDQTQISGQLGKAVRSLQGPGEPQFKVIEWGGGNQSTSIEELAAQVEASPVPVILVTTIQSLKAKVGAMAGPERQTAGASAAQPAGADPHNKQAAAEKRLRGLLGTLLFDEVHHAGAEQARGLIKALIYHPESRAMLYGTTATPMHREVPLIQELFEGRGFWANIDDHQKYLARSDEFNRSIEEVVDQLTHTIQRAELTPGQFHLVEPGELTGGKNDLFVRSTTKRDSPLLVLNPAYNDPLVERFGPLFSRHKQGFVAVPDTDEANRIAHLMNERVPGRVFAAFHSGMPKAEQEAILAKLRRGEINYLVTVRKLDEGVDVPEMTLYVDLNRSVGPRQILQRMGRVLRLHHNKEKAEIATLFSADEEEVREKLVLLERILKGDFDSRWESRPERRSARPVAYGSGPGMPAADRRAASSDSAGEELARRVERTRLEGIRDKLKKIAEAPRGKSPTWTPEVVADKIVEYFIENDRLPTVADGNEVYAHMHRLKEDPKLHERLRAYPEVLKAVLALRPHKERTTLGARGPAANARLLVDFVNDIRAQGGKARLPLNSPPKTLPEESILREQALYRRAKKSWEEQDPEFLKALESEPEVLALLKEKFPLRPASEGLASVPRASRPAPAAAPAPAQPLPAPDASARGLNDFVEEMFLSHGELRLPDPARPGLAPEQQARERELLRWIEGHRVDPAFRAALMPEARELLYGDAPARPAGQAVAATHPEHPAPPAEASASSPQRPSPPSAEAEKARLRHQKREERRERALASSKGRQTREAELQAYREKLAAAALDFAQGKVKTDAERPTSKELRLLAWARKHFERTHQPEKRELVAARLKRQLDRLKIWKANQQKRQLTTEEQAMILKRIAMTNTASGDYSGLNPTVKQEIQKKAFTAIARDPAKAGLRNEWGSHLLKVWSVEVFFQSQSYRVLYDLNANGQAEIIMIGTKDEIARAAGSRIDKYAKSKGL